MAIHPSNPTHPSDCRRTVLPTTATAWLERARVPAACGRRQRQMRDDMVCLGWMDGYLCACCVFFKLAVCVPAEVEKPPHRAPPNRAWYCVCMEGDVASDEGV